MIYRTYSELIQLPTFEERFRYLQLDGKIGDMTFGYDRYLNQMFYQSEEWRHFRNEIIVRDEGCDLAMQGHEIYPASCKDRRWSKILIHHLNPLNKEDILEHRRCILDPENVVCTRMTTHNAIHYGDESLLPKGPVVRSQNDMCPWRH